MEAIGYFWSAYFLSFAVDRYDQSTNAMCAEILSLPRRRSRILQAGTGTGLKKNWPRAKKPLDAAGIIDKIRLRA